MEADPDAELMLRLKNGEDRILNELMTRWQQPLVAFTYRYIGRETEALDLAQETFVRVYATRHRYAVRGKFSTWLFTIAANLCRNYLRWRQRWRFYRSWHLPRYGYWRGAGRTWRYFKLWPVRAWTEYIAE